MPDKELQIGDKTIGENTKISLSVKTALWIVGGIIALFSTFSSIAYFDIKSDVKEYKQNVNKEVQMKMDEFFDKYQENNINTVKDIEEIKGNVKVILDRTSNVRRERIAIEDNAPPGL